MSDTDKEFSGLFLRLFNFIPATVADGKSLVGHGRAAWEFDLDSAILAPAITVEVVS